MDGTPSQPCLPFIEHGDQGTPGAPCVLLHGFGGDARGWGGLHNALGRARRTIAFDLPGHGEARAWPELGGAGVAARAVTASLDMLDIERAHLVGHSMGGATAFLIALKTPERIASLTLLAPGGFGSEINHRILRRYAAARDADTLQPVLEQFFGWSFDLPKLVVMQASGARGQPGVIDALCRIVETLIDGKQQKTLPVERLADLEVPVKVVWGNQDQIVPSSHASGLPGSVAVHLFDGVGHMPHLEVPHAVLALIRDQIAHD